MLSSFFAAPEAVVVPSSRREKAVAAVLFVLAAAAFAFLASPHVFRAGNDASRFAHIEALVDQGEPCIEHSRYRWTVDRVELLGHAYSNKPPLLAIVGSGLYRLIESTTGWRFASDEPKVVKTLVAVLVGLPTAWLVARFFLVLSVWRGASPLARGLVTAALAAGTILTSYAVTLNSHVPAAVLVFEAVVAALAGRPLLAGLCCGVALCLEIIVGAVFAPVVLLLSLRDRRSILRCAGGLAAGVLLLALTNRSTTGSFLPPKLVRGGFDNGGERGANLAGVVLPDHVTYPIECLLGPAHGFLTVSPVLLFGVVGLARAMRRETEIPRRAAAVIGAGVLVFTLGHILLAGGYGGWSYGFRYLIPLIPLLLLFAPLALGGWRTALFVPVLAASVLLALLGAYNPWPPAYESRYTPHRIARLVRNPVGGNAAAFLDERAPETPLARFFGERFISPDARVRGIYLKFFAYCRGTSPEPW